MNLHVKICGMRDPLNISAVSETLPDYMGFIFYQSSPRYVGENFALPVDYPSSIKRVGVFVNEASAIIIERARQFKLDYIQLHGNETVEQTGLLRKEGLKIIKAFSVDEDFDFNTTVPYKQLADFFLFDTKGKYFGGNAKAFNWDILKRYDQEVPFFLSGGLNAENIHEMHALHNMNIHAVDLNSGVETAPALKDIEKINQINNIIHSTI